MRKTVRNWVVRAAVCAAIIMFAGCGDMDDSESEQSELQKPVTTYTVTFFPNAPADVEGAEKLVAESWTRFANDELRLPMGLFTLDGYHIVRWVDKVSGSSWGAEDSLVVLEDRSFYAVWEKDALWQITIDGISYNHYLDDEGNDYWVVGRAVREITEASIKSEIDGIPVTKISGYAFDTCYDLTSVTIPNGVTDIGNDAFCSCDSLVTVAIPDSVTSIGERAFENCDSLVSIAIPNSVTSIGDCAFAGCKSLTSVAIPDGVMGIGEYTFTGCNNLECITIGDGVMSIGDYAFNGCNSLISVIIPDSVTSIGDRAFAGCKSLTNIKIPDDVTSIGESAFENCWGLTSIEIPYNVTSIGKIAFAGCGQLETITVHGDNPSYSSQDGILYNKDKTELICVPQRISGAITIPNGVTLIGDRAFESCLYLTSVEIPDSVTTIGEYAFARCYFKNMTIPDSVTSIGESAFVDSYFLTEITLPFVGASKDGTDNTCLGYIFGGVDNTSVPQSLTSVIIHGDATSIGGYAFSGCGNLTSVTIGDGVTSLGSNAFSGCSSLTSVTIGGDVASIGYDTFDDCGRLKNITIDDSNPSYSSQDGIIYDKNKTEIIYVLKAISGSVTIPNSVTSIKSSAFNGCNSLTNIEIPDSVTSIGKNAFNDCRNLASITIDDGNPSYSSQDGIIYDKNKTEIIYVLKAISGAVEIPNGIRSIGSEFSGCNRLESIAIPDSVTSIEKGAFSGCSSLRRITLPFVGASKWGTSNNYLGYIFGGTDNSAVPRSLTVIILDGMTSVRKNTFSDCSGLVGVTIPDSVTSIENGAFSGCSNLTEMTLPFAGATKDGTSDTYFDYIFGGTTSYSDSSSYNSLVPQSLKKVTITGTVGNYAFMKCKGLTSVTIGTGASSIGTYAFYGCKGLTSLTIENGVSSIGSWAFRDCSGLTSLVLPNSVIFIGERAFNMCTGLTTVTMSKSLQLIDDLAFGGCMALMNIIFKGTPEQWDAIEKATYWDYSTGGVEGYWYGHKFYTVTYEY